MAGRTGFPMRKKPRFNVSLNQKDSHYEYISTPFNYTFSGIDLRKRIPGLIRRYHSTG